MAAMTMDETYEVSSQLDLDDYATVEEFAGRLRDRALVRETELWQCPIPMNHPVIAEIRRTWEDEIELCRVTLVRLGVAA